MNARIINADCLTALRDLPDASVDAVVTDPPYGLSNTTPADLAREVLAAEKVMDGTPGLLYLDGPTHEHEEAAGAILAAAPDLAHAVARVEALADRLENEAAYEASRGDTWDATCIRAEARRIRRALNGDDQ